MIHDPLWHQCEIKWQKRDTAKLLIAELIVVNFQDLSQGFSGCWKSHWKSSGKIHVWRYVQAGRRTKIRGVLNRDLAGEESSRFADVNREIWFGLKAEQFFNSLYLNLLSTFFGFFILKARLPCWLCIHLVLCMPYQSSGSQLENGVCLSPDFLPCVLSFWWRRHKRRPRCTSDLRPELGTCFAGDSGMVIGVVLLSAVSIICASKLLSMKRSLLLRAM